MMDELFITSKLSIPLDFFRVSYSRSSGPGGQNVNKLNTRVSIFLDVSECPYFTDRQKQILLHSLKGRIDKQGVLSVTSQQFRSQMANRNAAFERIAGLIRDALRPKRIRKKTIIPRRAIEKRLRDKKARAQLKKMRSNRDNRDIG